MSNVECLQKLLAAFSKDIEPLKQFQWTGDTSDHLFEMIQRAAIIRQWEALHAQIALSNTGHGHFGVTFIRPGYEELVWIKYLRKYPKQAGGIARVLAVNSGAKSVIQQEKYLGKNLMRKIGWSDSYLHFHHLNAAITKHELSFLAEKLGWSKVPPNFRWLSEKVGRGKEIAPHLGSSWRCEHRVFDLFKTLGRICSLLGRKDLYTFVDYLRRHLDTRRWR